MKKNIILILIVIILAVIPLFINSNKEFGGADGEAENVIMEIDNDYEPWIESIWAPPSGEVESLIFALQASLGTGVIAFGFGYAIGKRKRDK